MDDELIIDYIIDTLSKYDKELKNVTILQEIDSKDPNFTIIHYSDDNYGSELIGISYSNLDLFDRKRKINKINNK